MGEERGATPAKETRRSSFKPTRAGLLTRSLCVPQSQLSSILEQTSHPSHSHSSMSSSVAASTSSIAAGVGAEPIVDLALTYAKKSMQEQLAELAAYAELHTNATVSVPSFPAPQDLSDPDAALPVWPSWDAVVPACTHPTNLLQGPPDCYGSGAHLAHFEAHVANLFGKEQALFCTTGTMAQLVALRIHSQGRNKILACHPKCHLMLHEANVSTIQASERTSQRGEEPHSVLTSLLLLGAFVRPSMC